MSGGKVSGGKVSGGKVSGVKCRGVKCRITAPRPLMYVKHIVNQLFIFLSGSKI